MWRKEESKIYRRNIVVEEEESMIGRRYTAGEEGWKEGKREEYKSSGTFCSVF